VGLADVQAAYSGPECDLWELLMGAQIHVGGLRSSMRLADRAGIPAGSRGVDLCCCKGAGMQFLVRFRQVAAMTGVDFTPRVIDEGRRRAAAQGTAERVRFVLAEADRTGLPSAGADFVWGEDAWCYVADKRRLIGEAVRLLRAGGTIAFTDWLEGTVPLSEAEARRFMAFMKFPSLAAIDDYRGLLETNGCRVSCAEDTGQFASHVDLYVDMLRRQLTYDALQIVGFDAGMIETIVGELSFVAELARADKLIQAMFVAVGG
ncbi:MAG: methyltransferase domain-containing protein, partial [Planctomycetes bacterium]|nr:methyltransferase domain-containing protein [Planctomycetota bacterium]